MPIRPFLAGQAFEPEVIREMSVALQNVCKALGLALNDDANTRLVIRENIAALKKKGKSKDEIVAAKPGALLMPNGAVVLLTPAFSPDWFTRAFDGARKRENRFFIVEGCVT
jgi:hypothetical protein